MSRYLKAWTLCLICAIISASAISIILNGEGKHHASLGSTVLVNNNATSDTILLGNLTVATSNSTYVASYRNRTSTLAPQVQAGAAILVTVRDASIMANISHYAAPILNITAGYSASNSNSSDLSGDFNFRGNLSDADSSSSFCAAQCSSLLSVVKTDKQYQLYDFSIIPKDIEGFINFGISFDTSVLALKITVSQFYQIMVENSTRNIISGSLAIIYNMTSEAEHSALQDNSDRFVRCTYLMLDSKFSDEAETSASFESDNTDFPKIIASTAGLDQVTSTAIGTISSFGIVLRDENP